MPAGAGVFCALMLGWGLNAEGAKDTQRRREEGEALWGARRGGSTAGG